MNSFLGPMPGPIKNMLPTPMQKMMDVIQQYRQIKQHPDLLASFLQKQGMISEQQAKEIQGMGNNYEQVGQYLMQNGKMPTNVQQYENQVSQVQGLMNDNIKEHQ